MASSSPAVASRASLLRFVVVLYPGTLTFAAPTAYRGRSLAPRRSPS